MSRIRVGGACKKTVTGQWPSLPIIGENLQPVNGTGDVSKRVICLGFSVPLENFSIFGDVTLTVEGLQILPMLGTQGHCTARVLKRTARTVTWGIHSLLLATVGLEFSSSNLSPKFTEILGALAI